MNKFVMNQIREMKAEIRESDALFRRESDKQQAIREKIHDIMCDLIKYGDYLSEGTWTFDRYHTRNKTLVFRASFNMFPKLVGLAGDDGIHHSFYLKRPGMDDIVINFDDNQIYMEVATKDYGRLCMECGDLPVELKELHREKGRLLIELADIEYVEHYFREMEADKAAEQRQKKVIKRKKKTQTKECSVCGLSFTKLSGGVDGCAVHGIREGKTRKAVKKKGKKR